MARNTITSDEDDPLFEELGATRVVPSQDTPSADKQELVATQFTELSPSRILGKNLLRLGDYQLIEKLGEGAIGAVYKALDVPRQRTVALKVLLPHVANNPKLVKRLEREGKIMFELAHPNIIEAYAFDEQEGCHFVAMEYVDGPSMQKWLTQLGRLRVGDAVTVALDCAKALGYAHAHGKYHRDIKPDNILLTRSGIVKIADFGMVKDTDENVSLTQTGHSVGTPWYMPLEQARNAKDVDGRSDIYALGCTLYAFLVGHPPFTGRTIVDVIHAKETGSFPPARHSNPEVSERLDVILDKMIARLPKHRYQTCEELIKDLESLSLANRPLSFLQEKSATKKSSAPTQATIDTALIKSKLEGMPALDPNAWYLQIKTGEGKTTTKKLTTAQVQQLLADGKLKPTTQISHSPHEGFRALATYKEFRTSALSKTPKQAPDKNKARLHDMVKKVEEQERQREGEEQAGVEESQEGQLKATARYWFEMLRGFLPLALGILAIIGVIAVLVFVKWFFFPG